MVATPVWDGVMLYLRDFEVIVSEDSHFLEGEVML